MTITENYFPVFAVHLIVFSVIVAFYFIHFPSIRQYRKKVNFAIYVLVAALLGFFACITYLQYDIHYVGPAAISYNVAVDGEKQFFSGQISQLNISCKDSTVRPASFYLVLKSENASLTANQEGYIRVNSSEIKIPFNLPAKSSDSKPLQFSIDQNATGFAFCPSVEPQLGSFIDLISGFQAYGVWNSTSNSYTLKVDVQCLVAP